MGKELRAYLFLILLIVVLFSPFILQYKGIFHNDQAMSESLRHWFFAYNLKKGIFPLWNPHVWCGASPYYSFVYAGKDYYFFIFFWPLYLFANLANLNQSYWLMVVFPLFLHYLLAVIGMFVFLRKVIKCNIFPSFVGALVYVYSPAFSYAYVSENSLMLQAWFPWLLYVYMRSVKQKRLRDILLGSIILFNMWVASKPQYMIFVCIIWIGFIVVEVIGRLYVHAKGKKEPLRPLYIALAIFIFGTCLSAVYLYPLIQSFHYVEIGRNINPNFIMTFKPGILSFPYLITLLLPNFFGNITGNNFIFRPLMFWGANMSGGMAVSLLIFIVIILTVSRRGNFYRHKKYAALGIFLYIFSILCALGGNTPFYKLFISWIPIAGGMPYPILYRFIQCFATGLLAALSLNYIFILSRSSRFKYYLYKIIRYYFLFSSLIIITILFFPLGFLKDPSISDTKKYSAKRIFSSRSPVGIYTSRTAKLKEVRVMFTGESKGEIRYANSHFVSPEGGRLAGEYYVKRKGWLVFKVDIPPNKFLWIYPKTGTGKIVWRKGAAPFFVYKNNHWIIKAHARVILPTKKKYGKNMTLFEKLVNRDIESKPIVYSLLYWAIVIFLILAAEKILSVKKFVYLIGMLASLEFLVFALTAFYGCTFNEASTNARAFLPHNIRAVNPSQHPMVKTYREFSRIMGNSYFRFATNYPFYDNFVYFDNKYALMGEPALQLEKRFKHAFEKAYGVPPGLSMYYEGEGISPKKTAFLNNFSVKYFLNNDRRPFFPHEKCISLHNGRESYFHINYDALPRVYTIDNVIRASNEEQLRHLVKGDLRKAVYVNRRDSIRFHKNIIYDNYVNHFGILQRKNKINKADFTNPNFIKIDIDTEVPSMLVFTDVWYPGWKAWVDGRKTRIYRVNYCQRGILLEKGFHQVHLRFVPLDWCIGLGISLGTLGVMAFLLMLRRFKDGI